MNTKDHENSLSVVLKQTISSTFSLITSVICLILISLILIILLLGNEHTYSQYAAIGKYGIIDSFDDYMTNVVSTAADDFLSIKKVYKLNDHTNVAPKPCEDAYGAVPDPESLQSILEIAQQRMVDDTFLFQSSTNILDGSEILYYLDDTIFTVTWKEGIDRSVYTFSEIKIEHPSQFRRFLADGQFGSEKQYLTSQMAQSVNAVVASSGDFYKYRRSGILVYNSNVERFNINYLDSCFIDQNGDLIFSPVHEFDNIGALEKYVDDNNIRFSLCFGPILIENGESKIPHNYPLGEIGDFYARAAICQLGPLHYLLVTANAEGPYWGFPSLYQFSNSLIQRGIDKAYTLDGGQTATIVMNNNVINQVSYGSERYISDIIYFATAIPNKE